MSRNGQNAKISIKESTKPKDASNLKNVKVAKKVIFLPFSLNGQVMEVGTKQC